MHSRLIGYNLTTLIVPVPAAARSALEISDVGREWDVRLAEKAPNVAVASEQGWHEARVRGLEGGGWRNGLSYRCLFGTREAVVWRTHLGQTTIMLISHVSVANQESPLSNIVMSIHAAPASSTSRGDLVLQPNYFTSSVYVKALRDDISTLVLRYHEAYNQPGVTQPFALFKTVWSDMGWNLLQFRVFDSRSRHTFLEVTTRLFLGMSIH
jgi:hypothetical protein